MKTMITTILVLIFSSLSIAQNFWQVIYQPLVNPYYLSVSSNGNVYIAFENSLIRSTDNGQSWEAVHFTWGSCGAFGTSPTGVIYLYTDSLRKSTDEGNTWTTLNIPAPGYYYLSEPNSIMINDAGDIFVQQPNEPDRDTYRSTDEGNSWVTIGPDSSKMVDIIFKDNLCFASFFKYWGGGYLHKSSNNGDDWEIISNAPTNLYSLFAAKNGKLYGGRYSGGSPPGALFTSSDNGINWEVVSEFTNLSIFDIEENQFGHLYVVTMGNGVYRSTDGGNTWQQINEGLNSPDCWSIAVDSSGYVYVVANVSSPRLNRTINSTIPVELVSFSAKQIDNDVHLKWETATELNNHGFEIERKTETSDWRTIGFKEGNGTITERQFYTFIDDNISNGKYQYRLKQIDYDGTFEYSEIAEVEVLVINNFSLQQNFPNPFNPVTAIKFSLPVATGVALTIYNALGQKVAELVNGKLEAGQYTYQWNASNVASGMYIYELRSNYFVSIKKMVLMK